MSTNIPLCSPTVDSVTSHLIVLLSCCPHHGGLHPHTVSQYETSLRSCFSQLSHNYSEKSNEQGLFLDILFAVNGSAFLISFSAGWLLMCGKAIIFACMLIVLCITWLNCLSDLKFCYRKTQAATAIWIATNGLILENTKLILQLLVEDSAIGST